MNILIVCIQGMTSGVMANRLNEIANEKKGNYTFRACGWTKVNEHLNWADIAILTPQVKGYLNIIIPQLEHHQIKNIQVGSTDLSFNRILTTYENLIYLVQPKVKRTWQEKILRIGSEVIFICFLFSAIHLITLFTSGWIYEQIFYPLDSIMWNCMSFYLCIILSTYVLNETVISRTAAILLGIYAVLLVTPISFLKIDSSTFFYDLVVLGIYGPKLALYYLIVVGVSTWILKIILKEGNYPNRLHRKLTWIEMAYPMTLLTAFILLVRIIVSVFF